MKSATTKTTTSIRRRLQVTTLALAALTTIGGCRVLYENSAHSEHYAVYSDRSAAFIDRIDRSVDMILAGYRHLFALSADEVDFLTIVLEGADTDIVDHRYTPDVLGYYVPLFRYVSVDANPSWPQGDAILEQILAHEIAHHVLVTIDPAITERCWLNEGLAGVLESGQFDSRGIQQPLFHPVLFELAHREAYNRQRPRLAEFLQLDWSGFHDLETRERNYALAWSVVFFLLERHTDAGLSLGERITAILKLDHAEIAKHEVAWLAFLRGFDVTRHLLDLAGQTSPDRDLLPAWALEQLGRSRTRDDSRALRGLLRLFDDPRPGVRRSALLAFVRRLNRSPYAFLRQETWVRRGVGEVIELARSAETKVELRCALVAEMGAAPTHSEDWLPLLIELLSAREPALREVSAASLTKLAPKPTITDPNFWRAASESERLAEANDWQHWWQSDDRELQRRDEPLRVQ